MPTAEDFRRDARFPAIVDNMKRKVGAMAAEHVSKTFNTARADRAMIEKEMAAQTLSACFQMLAMDVLIAEEAAMHIGSMNNENDNLRKANKNLFEELRWTKVRMHAAMEELHNSLKFDHCNIEEADARIDAKVAALKDAGVDKCTGEAINEPLPTIVPVGTGGVCGEVRRSVVCKSCKQPIGPDDPHPTCEDCMPRVV